MFLGFHFIDQVLDLYREVIMLGNFLRRQLNVFDPINLHLVVRIQVELYLLDILFPIEPNHLHRVTLQLTRHFVLQPLAFLCRAHQYRLFSLDLHILVFEGQNFHKSESHVLVKSVIK